MHLFHMGDAVVQVHAYHILVYSKALVTTVLRARNRLSGKPKGAVTCHMNGTHRILAQFARLAGSPIPSPSFTLVC